MSHEHAHDLWESDAEARLLEGRVEGFWNPDYFSRVILPLLDLKPGARILDVGAGTGALTFLLARLLPDARLVGVDLTPSMISSARAQAESLGINNVTFQEGDVLALQFEGDTFDAVVCQTLLTHLSDPERAVREMARVIRPGGSFLATEFHAVAIDMALYPGKTTLSDEELDEMARYSLLFIKGYRNLGAGDFRIGSRIPFLAMDAGLEVVDVRINDRVSHAFPPYERRGQQASLAEMQGFLTVFNDEGYRTWITNIMKAGGGSENDGEQCIKLVAKQLNASMAQGDRDKHTFLSLMNPVLMVTIARKPL